MISGVSRMVDENISCEICGSDNNIIKHHLRYSEPEKTMFVCSSCHFIIHSDPQSKFYPEDIDFYWRWKRESEKERKGRALSLPGVNSKTPAGEYDGLRVFWKDGKKWVGPVEGWFHGKRLTEYQELKRKRDLKRKSPV